MAISSPAAVAQELAGTVWDTGSGDKPHVRFQADGVISGNASCNIFRGTYTTNGKRLTIKGFITTKKHCAGKMKAESAFLASLKASKTFKIGGQSLVLKNANGKRILTLQPK